MLKKWCKRRFATGSIIKKVVLKSTIIKSPKPNCEKQLFWLHGILGRGKNLKSFADDKRDLAEDVERYAVNLGINKAVVIGHSMGGKTASALATMYPSLISGIILLDSPPINTLKYPEYISPVLQVTNQLKEYVDLDKLNIKNREEIYKHFLNVFQENLGYRKLILQNIITTEGGVHWECNLSHILDNLDNIFGFMDLSEFHKYIGEILVIHGDRSYPYNHSDYAALFPLLSSENVFCVHDAGHWVHADQPKITTDIIDSFLKNIICKIESLLS